jgi:hypothetical protein
MEVPKTLFVAQNAAKGHSASKASSAASSAHEPRGGRRSDETPLTDDAFAEDYDVVGVERRS